ncbi:MAG TPA: hypothetical protein VI756_23670, partial [Blastocatellia bacterium]
MENEKPETLTLPAEEAPIIRSRYPSSTSDSDQYFRGYGYGYPEEETGGMTLREMLRLVRKRKWLIVAVTIIGTSLIALQIYRKPLTYKSTSLVEIGKETPLQMKQGGLVVESDDPDAIKTTMLTVKSDPVLQAAVKKLGLDKNEKFLHPEQAKTLTGTIVDLFGKSKKTEDKSLDSQAAGDAEPASAGRVEELATNLDQDLAVDLIRDTHAISIS